MKLTQGKRQYKVTRTHSQHIIYLTASDKLSVAIHHHMYQVELMSPQNSCLPEFQNATLFGNRVFAR